MKTETNGDLEALVHDRRLLNNPRPAVDRDQLQHHLREVLRLLHVDLESKPQDGDKSAEGM